MKFLPHFLLIVLGLVLVIQLVAGLFWYPVVWDEGWNLCVAKTWLEEGHYGCQILGELTGPRLSTGEIPVFLSKFGLEHFGLGYVAARVPFALFVCASVFFIFLLGRMLFGWKQGVAAAFLTLLITSDARIHPFFLAAQGFAEVVLMCAYCLAILLLGYALESNRATARCLLVLLSSISFAVALAIKALAVPFILFGLVFGLIYAFWKREVRGALTIFVTLALAYLQYRFGYYLPERPASINATQVGSGVENLYQILGFVWDPAIRFAAIGIAFKWFWVYFLALGFSCMALLRDQTYTRTIALDCVMSCVLGMVVPWFAWFLLLSIDFPRYIAVPVFVSSLFAAQVIYRFSSGYDFVGTWTALIHRLRSPGNFLPKSVLACALCVFLLQLALSLVGPYRTLNFMKGENTDLIKVAKYINQNTSEGALVETYDASLFHLLDRPFHYPPDQLHAERLRERQNAVKSRRSYSWEVNKPEIVVRGKWSRGAFGLYPDIATNPRYQRKVVVGEFVVFQKVSGM